MRYLNIFFVVLLLVTCKNNTDSPDVVDFCCCENDENHTSIADYWSCEQLLDTAGLKLYPFEPLTDEEWRQLNYASKLERRQIPADYISGMSTKALFYQFVYTELSHNFGVFNHIQGGVESCNRLNMFTTLLNRLNAGCTLIEILKHINPFDICDDGKEWPEPNCWWFYYCLQVIIGQPEVINNMTDADIDNYIIQQMRFQEAVRSLSESDPYHWGYCMSLGQILYGFYNILIRNKYEPFIQYIENDEYNIDWLMTNHGEIRGCNENITLILIDYIKQFKYSKK